MEGFEAAVVMLPTDDGLGYATEQKIAAPVVVVNLLDPSVDLATVRAEKRRREIEAMSRPAPHDPSAGDIDAAAERAHAAPGGRTSLREQLRINKEAKDAEWQEKNNPFRAPAGMDEEDFQMYMEHEETRLSKHAMQREQEAEDYKIFALAMQRKEAGLTDRAQTEPAAPQRVQLTEMVADPSLGFAHLTPASAASSLLSAADSATPTEPTVAAAALLPLRVIKRKPEEKDGKKEKKHHKKHKKEKSEAASSTAAASTTTPADAVPPAASAPESSSSGLAGLVGYSSDDDA